MAAIKRVADNYRKESTRFENEVNQLEVQLEEREKQLAELEKENVGLIEKDKKTQGDLSNLKKALEQAREYITKREEERNSFGKNIEEENKKQEDISSNVDVTQQIKKEKLQIEKENEELKLKVNKLENECATNSKILSEEKNSKFEAINKELEKEKLFGETKNKELQNVLEKLKEIEKQNLAKRDINTDKKVMEEQLLNFQRSNAELTFTLGQVKKRNEELQKDNKNLQENYEALNQTLKEMQDDTEKLREEKICWKKQISAFNKIAKRPQIN